MRLITFGKDTIAGAINREAERRLADEEGNKVVIEEKELVKVTRKATFRAVRRVLNTWLNRLDTWKGNIIYTRPIELYA